MNFEDKMAYCGLACEVCPIYWATREEDAEKQALMRADLARQGRENYGVELSAEQITDCDGCRSTGGRLYATCHTCKIRACARARSLSNCGHCLDYPCGQVTKILEMEPSARWRLEVARCLSKPAR